MSVDEGSIQKRLEEIERQLDHIGRAVAQARLELDGIRAEIDDTGSGLGALASFLLRLETNTALRQLWESNTEAAIEEGISQWGLSQADAQVLRDIHAELDKQLQADHSSAGQVVWVRVWVTG